MKVDADRQDAVKAFDALQKSSTEVEKQLRIEIANANTRTERLQLAIKDATAKLIGMFLMSSSLSLRFFPFLTVLQALLK